MPLPLIPIVTTVGRIALPILSREIIKLGGKKFVKKYGKDALTSASAAVTGGTIAKHYDDTAEKDKEQEVSTQVEEQPPKLPEEEPPKGPDIGTEVITETAYETTIILLEGIIIFSPVDSACICVLQARSK